MGWLTPWYMRLLLGAGALTLIKPGLLTDGIGFGLLVLALAARFLFRPAPIAHRPAAGE